MLIEIQTKDDYGWTTHMPHLPRVDDVIIYKSIVNPEATVRYKVVEVQWRQDNLRDETEIDKLRQWTPVLRVKRLSDGI